MKNKILFSSLIFSISLASAATKSFQQYINEAEQKISVAKDIKTKINKLIHPTGYGTIRNKDQYVEQLKKDLYQQSSAAGDAINHASKLAKTPNQHNKVEKLFLELEAVE